MPRGPSKERLSSRASRASQQKTTGAPVALASPTARPLQSILVCHSESSFSSSSSASSSFSSQQQQVSGKCVHFPCAPDKLNIVAYTHSPELYDRSPILPSAGAASLDIPSCRNDDEEGSWIQCLQRKVKEAVDEGLPAPHTKPVESSTPEHISVPQTSQHSGSSNNGGGSSSSSQTYDSSGTSSSDTEELVTPLSCSPPLFTPSRLSPVPSLSIFGRSDEKSVMVDAGVEEADDDSECEVASSEDEQPAQQEYFGRRPGMCSLGKFSRSSLFECDAFGGCALSAFPCSSPRRSSRN